MPKLASRTVLARNQVDRVSSSNFHVPLLEDQSSIYKRETVANRGQYVVDVTGLILFARQTLNSTSL